jgi:hypothetical protein
MLYTPGIFSPRSLSTGKETSNFPWREAHRLDVVLGQHTADVTESHVDKWKKGNQSGLLQGCSHSPRWINFHHVCLIVSKKKKVKQSHNTPMEAQEGTGCIAPTHSRPPH